MYQIVCSTLLPVTSLREVNFKVHKMLVFLINFNNYFINHQSLIPLTSLNHANVCHFHSKPQDAQSFLLQVPQ